MKRTVKFKPLWIFPQKSKDIAVSKGRATAYNLRFAHVCYFYPTAFHYLSKSFHSTAFTSKDRREAKKLSTRGLFRIIFDSLHLAVREKK